MALDELLTRQMPHSLEAEQAVLGSMLIDASCVKDVMDRLQPEDFYLRQNREIFETIYTMFSYSKAIDGVTVAEEMQKNGTYDEKTTRSYLVQLMEVTPTSANAMAVALYVNAKAANAGIPIDAVETYAFQGGIFDNLSPEYQETYLASGLLMAVDVNTVDQETRDALVAVLGEEALEPATQEAIQAQVDQISAMMETWKNRDVAGFEKIYNKEAILESDDELNSKLFIDRDPGMIQYAADYLSQEGSHTGLMVVGAGHMVGDTGIVQGLIDQGYTVEVVPNP